MNLPKRSMSVRPGFTLVELLVAIAIIGILVAMLVPAVMNVLGKGTQVKAASEISQFDNSIQAFKQQYNAGFIPSQIKLCERFSDYNQNNQIDKDSINYLQQLFPKLLTSQPNGAASPWGGGGYIDWNGNGQYDGPVVLEGHQCLVFFLGGIPLHGATPGCFGFATDPRDPSKLAQTTGRNGPFFEFDTSRLGLIPNPAGQNGYYSYFDPYSMNIPPHPQTDKPYAYFSNYGQRNNYNFPTKTGYPSSDCNTLGVTAYCSAVAPGIQFYNANSYQIISAGLDQKFGPGSFASPSSPVLWTPQSAGSIAPAGRDDLSNFNSGNSMGVGG
jgi:prepilin-type N-terminal cleavage/methylation domain-containing protein